MVSKKTHAIKEDYIKNYLNSLFIIFLVNLILMLFDPFGIDSALDTHTAKIISKISSISYPNKNIDEFLPAQKDISVILLTEDTREKDNVWSWPPSFENHATLLEDIASFGPRAIFIDLLFIKEQLGYDVSSSSHISTLIDKIGKITQLSNLCLKTQIGKIKCIENSGNGIPVIVTANSADDIHIVKTKQEGFNTNPGIATLNRLNDVAILAPTKLNRENQSYPLKIGLKCTSVTTCSNQKYYTPAALQYIISEGLYETAEPSLAYINMLERNLHINWGWTLDTVDHIAACNTSLFPCSYFQDQNKNIDNRKLNILRLVTEEVIYNPFRSLNTIKRAPYHPVITTKLFYGLKNRGQLDSIAHLIEGRLITIGSSFIGQNNAVDSPVHGIIHGAFAHTMALDNLIERGEGYDKSPAYIFGIQHNIFGAYIYQLDFGEAFEFFMILASFSIVYLLATLIENYRSRSTFSNINLNQSIIFTLFSLTPIIIYANIISSGNETALFTIAYLANIVFIIVFINILIKKERISKSAYMSLITLTVINTLSTTLLTLSYLDNEYKHITLSITSVFHSLLILLCLIVYKRNKIIKYTRLFNFSLFIIASILTSSFTLLIAMIFIDLYDLPPYDWAKTAIFSIAAYYVYRYDAKNTHKKRS